MFSLFARYVRRHVHFIISTRVALISSVSKTEFDLVVTHADLDKDEIE